MRSGKRRNAEEVAYFLDQVLDSLTDQVNTNLPEDNNLPEDTHLPKDNDGKKLQ